MKIVQAVFGSVPPALRDMVAVVKAQASAYQLVKRPAIRDMAARRVAADNLRFELLRDGGEDLVWCDLDCVPTPKFEHVADGQPHAGYYPLGNPAAKPQPDIFLCWGPSWFWKELLERMRMKWPAGPPDCWYRKLLRDDERVIEIPAEQYTHTMHTMNLLREARRKEREARHGRTGEG